MSDEKLPGVPTMEDLLPMPELDVPAYTSFLSRQMIARLLRQARPVPAVSGLRIVGGISPAQAQFESVGALRFIVQLYEAVRDELNAVLVQRQLDREFIDTYTKLCTQTNHALNLAYDNPNFHTIIGMRHPTTGKVVVGPRVPDDGKAVDVAASLKRAVTAVSDRKVAPLPSHLRGEHVTLFGPPDSAKMAINAMNAAHRILPGEPTIVRELMERSSLSPKWGADDEDSKTPLRGPLLEAAMNLQGCFNRTLSLSEPDKGKHYRLASTRLSQPIKRVPGLALPSPSHFWGSSPLPLHLYDFALHVFHAWSQPEALTFYIPKIETEDEATYLKNLISTTENMLKSMHPEYKLGTIRVILVLENARAVFRVNEIIDNMYPYFAGASLGWHDYLASTARLFAEDSYYRIPVKADPNIVIKHIKESHVLLSKLVGPRGGIKIGGMYGVLPMDGNIKSASFQVTMGGFIRDVIIQLKRGLDGFWVAHPDFVRIGIALVEAWKLDSANGASSAGDSGVGYVEQLVRALITNPARQNRILSFVTGDDVPGLDPHHPLYARALLAADVHQSNIIANNDPVEIRYNVFQCLQYLADWLSGNGCVALPATIDGVDVRVMDDLATTERSRWEVWHEIHHGRFALADFFRIVHEEMHFIRKGMRKAGKVIQVGWNARTAKWYPIAQRLIIRLMTDEKPVEFATELLLPFTIDIVRDADDPWHMMLSLEPEKYKFTHFAQRFNMFFEACGCQRFALTLGRQPVVDMRMVRDSIMAFTEQEIIEAASFHGTIGQSKKGLDQNAAQEQARVLNSAEKLRRQLYGLGQAYTLKFGIKFMIAASGRSAEFILGELQRRMGNTKEQELVNARIALYTITCSRLANEIAMQAQDNQNMLPGAPALLSEVLEQALRKYRVNGVSVALLSGSKDVSEPQVLSAGFADVSSHRHVTPSTRFEVASLSKTFGIAFALEYFVQQRGHSLDVSVNKLLRLAHSPFRINAAPGKPHDWGNQVTLRHLASHCSGLGMHYVYGIPLTHAMPDAVGLLEGKYEQAYGYRKVYVDFEPGTAFQYSGAATIIIQNLLECFERKPIADIMRPWLDSMGLQDFSFTTHSEPGVEYATGYTDNGAVVPGTRLMFPPLAAGGIGTTRAMAVFMNHLVAAYHNPRATGAISHSTALLMLRAEPDVGSRKFMGIDIGLGTFVGEVGPNRVAVHQAANDGFRGLYCVCYTGPDAGQGFVIIANGDNAATLMIASIAQDILLRSNWQGIDYAKLRDLRRQVDAFSIGNFKQEEIVNQGYRNLVFAAFDEDLPEVLDPPGPYDHLAQYNIVVGAKVESASNQRFACASNLVSPHMPRFDARAFGRHGKIMDSWESVRHNPTAFDLAVYTLDAAAEACFVMVSTAFHDGNHAAGVAVEGRTGNGQWVPLVGKTKLDGHSIHRYRCEPIIIDAVRVKNYPDGGITRLGIYGSNLPAQEQGKFPKQIGAAAGLVERVAEPIPAVQKLFANFTQFLPTQGMVVNAWQDLSPGSEVDISSARLGGKVTFVTNQHYGPAFSVLAPFKAQGMFDGFETARSREPGHRDYLELELPVPTALNSIQIDFTYFVNNNPLKLAIDGFDVKTNQWVTMMEPMVVKHYAANTLVLDKLPAFHNKTMLSKLRVYSIPCGGYNRIKCFATITQDHLDSMKRRSRL
jgi:malate synthase